jgi:hypothetical protein
MFTRTCVAAAALMLLPATGPAGAKDLDLFEFNTMTPVVRPFTGAANPIRGVNGGGIPWMIRSAKGELEADGRIEVRVRGLVLAEGANAGTNPVTSFKAIVSCLTPTTDGSGALVVATVNRSTNTFPASAAGNAEIEDVVSLPSPCIAPIVFVTTPTGSWLAATGN